MKQINMLWISDLASRTRSNINVSLSFLCCQHWHSQLSSGYLPLITIQKQR